MGEERDKVWCGSKHPLREKYKKKIIVESNKIENIKEVFLKKYLQNGQSSWGLNKNKERRHW